MRLILLLLAISLSLFLSFDSNAQVKPKKKKAKIRMTFGPKAGLNMQEIYGGSTYDVAYKPGITGGVFLSVNRRNHGLRTEALINTGRINSYYGNYHINTVSVNIPALYEVKIVRRLWLQFGPQFTTMISARRSGVGGNDIDVKNKFRNADIAAVAGLELALRRKFLLGARYIYGFVDVNNTSYTTAVPETWRNRGIQLYLGYRCY